MGEIQVRGLFATPVAALMVPQAEARDAEQEDSILRKRAERPSLGASNIGGWADDAALGGEFERLDPRRPAPMMHAASLKFGGEDGVSAGSAETIRPRAGLMFPFPSFLPHAAPPYRGQALRISIAFNLGLCRPL